MNAEKSQEIKTDSTSGFFSSLYEKIADSVHAVCTCCQRNLPSDESRKYIMDQKANQIPTSDDFFEVVHHDLEEVQGSKDNSQTRKEPELRAINVQMEPVPSDSLSLNYDFSDKESIESSPYNKGITKKTKIWTKKDDDLLLSLAEKYSAKNWKEIAKSFHGRTGQECFQRWKKLKPCKKRRPWDPSEDQKLHELFKTHGTDWAGIASKLFGRSGKQVRERFLNTLDPSINKEKWSKQEDKIILTMYYQIGSKWSEISKVLKNRPENMVKNRFYSHIKKKLIKKSEEESEEELLNENYSSDSGTTMTNGNESNSQSQISASHEEERKEGGIEEEKIKEERRSEMEIEEEDDRGIIATKEKRRERKKKRKKIEFMEDEVEERMDEENGNQLEVKSKGSSNGSGESISNYLNMKDSEEQNDNMVALEFAIQEADDKMKQAYYILSNQIINGATVDLSGDITKLKMMIEALKTKKNYLEEIKMKKNGLI